MRWESATSARQIGQGMPARTTMSAQSAQKAAWKHGLSAAATGASMHTAHVAAPAEGSAGAGAAAARRGERPDAVREVVEGAREVRQRHRSVGAAVLCGESQGALLEHES